MILCNFIPSGGSLARISTENKALTYQWYDHIQSLNSIKFATSKVYGGYAKPSFSSLKLWPTAFEDDWPPPYTADVVLIETDTTEAAGTVIYDGTATLDIYDRASVGYNLQMPELSTVVINGVLQSGTLVSLFTSYCATLGLTFNSTNARSSSPAVSYTPDNDIPLIDMMDDMAAFFTHGFTIIEGTLYLYDMLVSLTAIALDEFDVLPCSYRGSAPISLVEGGGQSVAGSSPNGDERSISIAYHTTAGNIITALTDIKTMLEKDEIIINAPIDKDKPKILDDLTFYDESTIQPTTTAAKVTSVVYNYDSGMLRIEARGTIS